MEGMDHGMMMNGTEMNGTGMHHHKMMMMHMTFFWGKNAEVLFSGWPGTSTDMYVLALIVVFLLAVLVEWISHCQLTKPGSNHVAAGLIRTVMHAVRMALAYMVMLAVMSFNVGIFIAAIVGHTVGFLFYGSRIFRSDAKGSDLPPLSC